LIDNIAFFLDQELAVPSQALSEQTLSKLDLLKRSKLLSPQLESTPGFIVWLIISMLQQNYHFGVLDLFQQAIKLPIPDHPETTSAIFEILINMSLVMSLVKPELGSLAKFWFENLACEQFLQVNKAQNVIWFNKESFLELAQITFAFHFLKGVQEELPSGEEKGYLTDIIILRDKVMNAFTKSDYQVEKFLTLLLDTNN
jgi:hypothetical protein